MTKILLISLFAIVAGAGAVVNAIWGPRARARRRLLAGPRTIIDGEIVTVVGSVRAITEQLTAPLTGRACVAFEATARLYKESLVLGDSVVQSEITTFELVTPNDGVIVVDAKTAELVLPVVPLIPRRLELERAFLEAHAKSLDYIANSAFEEVVVSVGDRIAVQGMAVIEPAQGTGGYRDGATRVRLVEHGKHPVTIGEP